ncbi:ATP-binding protein [Pseudonocardia sp. HH130630-07]|uniref:ATP-binding protein n=1 Tax=Pseudonocardia sp. HH130630-07 TaxID=1690815 RepID=UPI000814C578|nr:ATP-binding protein [Pseudonocardia sp. HH130630-07]ANY08970.1 hypothetical protein AFB00_24910 [Pseudonocardia sp. HH130630-07]
MSGLQHVLCWYTDEADLRDRLADTVLAALREGAGVGIELRPCTERALRARVAAELGADAVAGLVRLRRDPGPDGPSGQTDIVRAARVLREHVRRTGGPITVVCEYVGMYDDPDGSYWAEVEAAAAVALADLPLRLYCWFPEAAPPGITEMAGVTHAQELRGGVVVACPSYQEPRVMLNGRGAAAPAEMGPPVTDLPFDAIRLRDVRNAVGDVLREQGFGEARIDDVVVAVNEVATNAVHHGSGTARLMIWTPGEEIVCEVHDGGRLADPLPGLVPPHPRDGHGRGIWIARQLCDLLHVWSDDRGTHVRIRAAA